MIQLRIPRGKVADPRNRACEVCGSRQMDYRVRTHDYRCKDCGEITQIPGSQKPPTCYFLHGSDYKCLLRKIEPKWKCPERLPRDTCRLVGSKI